MMRRIIQCMVNLGGNECLLLRDSGVQTGAWQLFVQCQQASDFDDVDFHQSR